jgi:hypothetical protein
MRTLIAILTAIMLFATTPRGMKGSWRFSNVVTPS